MRKAASVIFVLLIFLFPLNSYPKEIEDFQTVAPQTSLNQELRLRTNLLPWLIAVPDLGIEYAIGNHWSALLDVWFCPWKVSDRYALKTIAVFPEGRFWIKSNKKGSFFNIHLNLAWFNVRANNYRYQSASRPLLGAGIGYGYRLEINNRWGFEFEIGLGMANAKYDRYYNIDNGALIDVRKTTYWGVDRLSLAFSYNLGVL